LVDIYEANWEMENEPRDCYICGGMMEVFSLCSLFLLLIVDVVGALVLVASDCVCGWIFSEWWGWL
jgi:hypothetical protein